MNKKNMIMWLISILIAIVLLVVISKLIFSGINGLNQGKLRVSDAILTSTATVEDVAADKTKWKINISQTNKLALLIQGMGDAEISKIEIDKMKVVKSPKIGTIYISEPRTKELKNIGDSKNESVAIYVDKRKDGSNYIEIDILNKDIVKNFVPPDETNQIRHDGTALAVANKTIDDIYFEVSFNLNIIQTNGEKSKCKISLKLPESTVITNGQVVTRLSLSDFKFKS